jgi:hypothetical protein
MNLKLARWIHRNLGNCDEGQPMAPNHHMMLRFGPVEEGGDSSDGPPLPAYVISAIEDGWNYAIGTPDKCEIIIPRKDAYKMAGWLMRRWVFTEWFGVRRWLWFKALIRVCEEHKRIAQLRWEFEQYDYNRVSKPARNDVDSAGT